MNCGRSIDDHSGPIAQQWLGFLNGEEGPFHIDIEGFVVERLGAVLQGDALENTSIHEQQAHRGQQGTLRFGELQRLIPKVTQQLRELEEVGLVHRQVYAEVPPRVEYRLTAHGLSLEPILHLLREWGNLHRAELGLLALPSLCTAEEPVDQTKVA